MRQLSISLLLFCLCLLLHGCQKDRLDPIGEIGDPDQATILLSKVTYASDSLYDVYEYNDRHEVSKITTFSVYNSEPLKYNLYFYDSEHQLVRREFYRQEVDFLLSAYETLSWEGNEVTKLIYVLYYDADNQKVAEELYQKHTYVLNDKLEKIRYAEFQNIPGLGLINSSYTDYSWEHGNITEKVEWELTDDGAEHIRQPAVSYQYDDQPNPYRFMPHEMLNRPWLNNVVEEKDEELIITYQYTYNESGYIQSVLKKTLTPDESEAEKDESFTYDYITLD